MLQLLEMGSGILELYGISEECLFNIPYLSLQFLMGDGAAQFYKYYQVQTTPMKIMKKVLQHALKDKGFLPHLNKVSLLENHVTHVDVQEMLDYKEVSGAKFICYMTQQRHIIRMMFYASFILPLGVYDFEGIPDFTKKAMVFTKNCCYPISR